MTGAVALDEPVVLAMACPTKVTPSSPGKLARRHRLAGIVASLFARRSRPAGDALEGAIVTRDDRARPVATGLGSAGRALLRRPAATDDETAGGLHLATRRAHARTVEHAALVRVVFATADEPIAVAPRHHAGALGAERRCACVAAAMHAGGDLLAARRLGEALAERIALAFSFRRGLGEPPVDAGAGSRNRAASWAWVQAETRAHADAIAPITGGSFGDVTDGGGFATGS